MTELQKVLAAAEQRIEGLQGQITGLQNTVKAQQDTINGQLTEIDGLNRQLAATQTPPALNDDEKKAVAELESTLGLTPGTGDPAPTDAGQTQDTGGSGTVDTGVSSTGSSQTQDSSADSKDGANTGS